jgi:dTDP-4-amino-4,6-dideoxygalactose transaminase
MRDKVKDGLRAEGIGAQVHYLPLHMQPYLRQHARLVPPYSDAADYVLTLPLFPTMSEQDQDDVIQALRKIVGALQE